MADQRKSMVRLLREMAHWMDDRDELVIECDGYELIPYAIEVDEYAGQLIIKCDSPADDEDGAGDDGEETDETGGDDRLPWAEDACDVPERPIETLDISDNELKEG